MSATENPNGAAGAAAPPRRQPRVSIYLLVFVLLVALVAPAAGFLAFIVAQHNEEREREVALRGERLAGEIADRLEQEVRTLSTMLAVFASSGWLEEGQFELLHLRARRALAGTDRALVVLDENFDQVLNTAVPFGTSPGEGADHATAVEVLERGARMELDLLHARVEGKRKFDVLRRIELANGRELTLILTRDAAELDRLLGSALDLAGWSFALLDGAGQVATSVIDPEQSGDGIPGACLDPVFGFRTWGAPENQQFVFGSKIDGAPWSVCVWGGAERLLARAKQSWTLLRSVAAAVMLSAVLSRAISNTARVGEALDAGREVAVAPSFISEVDDVRRSLARAAADRLRIDRELRLLLRETAHRAKNQIALAVSLLGLSARSATDIEALRRDLSARLVALGRSLDAVTGRRIDAAPLRELVDLQLGPFLDDGPDRFECEGEDVLLSQNAAQSLSLVLHELATNASKYGAWSRPEGKVAIRWETGGGRLTLDWRETGAPAREPERAGFGTTLVDMLIGKSFGGTVERRFDESGFRCRVAVPLEAITPAD